jgi:DNA-binding helix-hairpin-helix protein with protein kinase domain
MQVRRQSTGQTIGLDTAGELGAGGEARIFAVHGTNRLVAKIYHRPDEKHLRKLKAMLANPPHDPTSGSGRISIAWPTDILCSNNGNQDFLGFLMPRVSGLRPLMEVYNPRSRKQFCPLFTYAYLLRAARNLASAVSALHTANCVLGDINESNTLVSSDALITLVDTDSFQIRDPRTSETYRCPVGKGEFTPPELQGETFTDIYRKPEHDRFGLGVLIFQLLMEGTHPFSGVPVNDDDSPLEAQIKNGHFPYGSRSVPFWPPPSALSFSVLHPELQILFRRCFDEGHKDPGQRPSANLWRDRLQESENKLKTCSVNSQHIFGTHLSDCPWCARKKRLAGRDPFPSKRDVKAHRHLNSPPPTPPPVLKNPAASPKRTITRSLPLPPKQVGQTPASRVLRCLFWIFVIGAISASQRNCSQLVPEGSLTKSALSKARPPSGTPATASTPMVRDARAIPNRNIPRDPNRELLPSPNRLYRVPDLRELVGKPVYHGELYGDFMIVDWQTHSAVLRSRFGRFLSGDTWVIVTFDRSAEYLRDGKYIVFPKQAPLQILSVERKSAGGIVVAARF